MQYPLAYKTKQGIRELMFLLEKEGYSLLHGLNHVEDDDHIIAICVDLDKRKVFTLNATCMACFCAGKRKPLYVEEMIENFEELIVKKDNILYEKMLQNAVRDNKRPGGFILSYNEVEKFLDSTKRK